MPTASTEGSGGGTLDPGEMPKPGTAAARYEVLATDKLIYLQRARDAARVTIPMLFPQQGHSSATTYFTPFQSVGADGLNNLASKLVLALFPPGEPFFKLNLTGEAVKQMQKESQNGQGEDMRGEAESALSQTEQVVIDDLENQGARIAQTEAVKQLLVAGNALIEISPDNKLKAHRLENYVVRRDIDGHPIEIIHRQTLKRDSLPDEGLNLLAILEKSKKLEDMGQKGGAVDRTTDFDGGAIDVLTIAIRNPKKKVWQFHQEMMGHVVPDTDGTWPLETPALIPLCWTRIQGEHYGRGFIEEYQGDLNSLEALTQAMVEFAAIAAKVNPVVDETGVTSMEDVTNSANGEAINGTVKEGRATDVAYLQVEKMQDFNIALQVSNKIEERLNRAFMKTSSVQRDAERVTAEEIRILAKELEAALGGSYAILAQEFQRPLVRRVMLNLEKKKKLTPLPKGMVRPEIVAGLEGLGREAKLQKLDTLIQGLAQNFGPQAVAQYVNVGAYLMRRGAALGVDMTGIVKSDDEVAQAAQQQQQSQTMDKLGPHMIKAMSEQGKSMREHPGSPVDAKDGPVGRMMPGVAQ